jgi:hypothetical protein
MKAVAPAGPIVGKIMGYAPTGLRQTLSATS